MEQSCQRFPCRLRNPSTFGDENFLSVWCQLKKNHAILFVFSRRTSHSPHPFLSQLFPLETWSRPKGQFIVYVKRENSFLLFMFLLEQPQEKWLSRERAQIFPVGSRSPWTPCPKPSRYLVIIVDWYCYRTRVRSLVMLVTNSLTHSLTHSLRNLSDHWLCLSLTHSLTP